MFLYFLYDAVLFLAYLCYLPVYALRGRVHADILSRLGFFKKDLFAPLGDAETIWLHAVSVGEARAADSLLRLIRREWPDKRLVVSTVTPTGYAIVRSLLEPGEVLCYAPLDISVAVSAYLKAIRPRLLIIMETELWPNLIRLSHRAGAKIAVVNGRISDRSFGRYGKMKPFVREILGLIDLLGMQNDESASRIRVLGAPADRVRVCGNIKFDSAAPPRAAAFAQPLCQALAGCLCWIAGSTHEKEEEAVVAIYRSLVKDFKSLRLIVAPRHLERTEKVRRLIRFQGLEVMKFSRLAPMGATGNVKPLSSGQVLLVDTIGDLSGLYAFADVVFIGGSLVKKGGHNPIEPAIFGKPVFFGKYMHNFKEIRDVFLRNSAAVEVLTPEELEYGLRKILADGQERQALGRNARRLIEENRGAAQCAFDALKSLMAS
jgi:3-deoxy-D-manno-octulosonic-acid transferase